MIPALSAIAQSPPSLGTWVGSIATRFNIVQNGGRAFNTTDTDTGGSPVWGAGANSSFVQGFTGPDGTTTAAKFKEDANFGTHRCDSFGGGGGAYAFGAVPPGGSLSFQTILIAKASGRTRIVIEYDSQAAVTCSANFDLVGGNTGFDNITAGSWSTPTSSMTSIGNGWWVCRMIASTPGTAAAAIGWHLYLDNGSGTAARSTSYNGNNVDGVLLWFMNVLPTAATQIIKNTFFDGFDSLSTIDVNDTGATGYNWYTHNRWPNGPPPNFTTAVVSPANTFSVASSILTIAKGANTQTGNLNLDLSTARVDPANSSNFIGQVFSPPYIYEARMAWDHLVCDGINQGRASGGASGLQNGACGVLWCLDVDSLIGNYLTVSGYATNPRAGEIDTVESPSGIAVPAVTYGYGPIDYHALVAAEFTLGASLPPQPTSLSDFHNYAQMVLPATASSAGVIMSFRDGIWTRASLAYVPAVGTGFAFSDFNVFRMPIFLAGYTGGTFPSLTPTVDSPQKVDWVRVSQ